MPISIKSIGAAGYAPLLVDGKAQELPASPQATLTFWGAGAPSGAGTPALLCNEAAWLGQLSVQLSNDDGFPWNPSSFLQLTASYTLPSGTEGSFTGLWHPPSTSGPATSKVTQITLVLVPDATLTGAPTCSLLGPLSFRLMTPGGYQDLGSHGLEIYVGPVPPGGVGEATDVFELRRWVARDLPAQQATATDPFAACTLAAFAGPPGYASATHYWTVRTNDFDLTDWLFALTGIQPRPATANCYDSTAMSCVLLALQTFSVPVNFWGGDISNFGWLQQSVPTRGGGASALVYSDHMVTLADAGSGPVVLDATFGPHTGSETPAQYLQNMLKPDPPREVGAWAQPPSNPVGPNPSMYPGSDYLPLLVDGESFSLTPARLPQPQRFALNRAALAALTGLGSVAGSAPATPAAPGPTTAAPPSLQACPALPGGLSVVHQRTVHGHPVSRRSWTLAGSALSLRVDAWVCSDGAAGARERFLDEGAGSSSEMAYASGPPIGQACVVRELDGVRELLCLSGGLVLRVADSGGTTEGTTDLAALGGWLVAAAAQGAVAPTLRALTPSRARLAVGDVARLELDGDAHLPVRLLGAAPCLKLIGGDDRGLTLRAVRPGDAVLTAVVVDPATLLSARATAAVTVVAVA